MSDDLKEKLNVAGVRHITAVSGMHVVIVTTALMSLLIMVGLYRGQAFYGALFIMILFVLMTGLQPSAMRAGIMTGLLLLGQKLGRHSMSSRAIVAAAAVMLFLNPVLLFDDAGFQLSFAAVLGIVYAVPLLMHWLKRIPGDSIIGVKTFKMIVAMTMAAYLFTLPLLVYNFGRISLAAPLTNTLVVPLVYWIMLLGFVFVLAGVLWYPLGWLCMVPVWLLLAYVVQVITVFADVPFAAVAVEHVHWLWLGGFYVVLGVGTWWLRKRTRAYFLP